MHPATKGNLVKAAGPQIQDSPVAFPIISCSSLNTDEGITTKDKEWTNLDQNFVVEIKNAPSGYYMVDLSLAVFYNDESEQNVFGRVLVQKGEESSVAGAIQERHAKSEERSAFLRGIFKISNSDGDTYSFYPQWKVDGGTGHLNGVNEAQQGLTTNFLSVWQIGDEEYAGMGGDGANS